MTDNEVSTTASAYFHLKETITVRCRCRYGHAYEVLREDSAIRFIDFRGQVQAQTRKPLCPTCMAEFLDAHFGGQVTDEDER